MSGDWWDDLAEGIRLWTRVAGICIVLIPILLVVIVVLVMTR